MKPKPAAIIYAMDVAGTFLFAVEGAIAAADAGLDVFGIMVLSFSTALVGGVVRDMLIGSFPPQAIKDWRYPAIAFAGGARHSSCTAISWKFRGLFSSGWRASDCGSSRFASTGLCRACTGNNPRAKFSINYLKFHGTITTKVCLATCAEDRWATRKDILLPCRIHTHGRPDGRYSYR
jgi:hypothetical protein